MTNSLDPLAGIVPEGYATVRLMAEDRQTAVRAINKGLDRWIDEFEEKQKLMEKALGWRRQSDPMKRLAAYLVKPDHKNPMNPMQPSWDEQFEKFPQDYEEDWRDYQELRARAEAGEFQYRR